MDEDEFWEAIAAAYVDEWRNYANCLGSSGEIFLEDGHEEAARSVCNGCCVQLECIDDAIKWGDAGHRGLSEIDRWSVIRHRKRYNKLFVYDMEKAGLL